MKKYRIGVIGAGARGETFARQLYRGTGRAELFGICDVDADRLAKFCEYCGLDGGRQFTDPHEFLTHADLDAVIITTPEFTHADVAIEAMAAGKGVYLEKPLAHSLTDCYRIVEAERKHPDSVAFVGFNQRASAGHIKLKEIVDSGVLGQVVHIAGLEQIHVAHGASFDVTEYRLGRRRGGHGGSDPKMLGRFVWAMDNPGKTDSGVLHGLAATLLALKAEESMASGKVIEIDPREYHGPVRGA